jgi:hypothetical protein
MQTNPNRQGKMGRQSNNERDPRHHTQKMQTRL